MDLSVEMRVHGSNFIEATQDKLETVKVLSKTEAIGSIKLNFEMVDFFTDNLEENLQN